MLAEVTKIILIILNIFMIPSICTLVESKINSSPLLFSFRNVVLYFFYTVIVFASSKIIAHIFNLLLHAKIEIDTVPYTFISIVVSVFVPFVIKLLRTRFDFNIVIKAKNEE